MSKDGLPIGIHLAAPYGNDEELIALCAELEAAQPWAARRPLVLA
jgi:amidase/6-aminohexanoate-cyclic-dimer hydrolase